MYNVFERQLARWLNRFPALKSFIKRLYQAFNFIIYRKKYEVYTHFQLFPLLDRESFFGYYDKSPENRTGEYVIFHTSPFPTTKKPALSQPITIVLYDLQKKTVLRSWNSFAYNWQQGSKIQWIDDYKFIFNDYDPLENKFVAKLIDVAKDCTVSMYPFPVYDVYKNVVLSLNFSRLALLRPDYGYINVKPIIDLKDVDSDGIYKGDLANSSFGLFLSLRKIMNLHYDPVFESAIHKVNHILFSPDGEYFIFLHRYFLNGRKYDRLILSNIQTGALTLLSDHEMVSHCFWLSTSQIIAYMRRYDHGDGYYIIDIHTKKIEKILNPDMNNMGDGHPNVYGNWVVFDTYPDRARHKHLWVYNLQTEQLTEIGSFYESLKYYEQTRCDLHPRWNYNGTRIYFDSVHEGMRKLYFINFTVHE